MSSDSDVDYQDGEDTTCIKTKCNWCLKYVELAEGKKYCVKCLEQAYKICCRCKRPLPDNSYFELDPERCNSCSRKLNAERLKRTLKKGGSVDSEKQEIPIDLSSKAKFKKCELKKKKNTDIEKNKVPYKIIPSISTVNQETQTKQTMKWMYFKVPISSLPTLLHTTQLGENKN